MAGTQNNIFLTAGEPVMRYVNVPKHGVTGFRLNPDDNERKIQFQLVPTPDPPFEYERDVIELYSEKEVKFFKQANKYLFQSGFLAEYQGEPEPIDTTNMLTDVEVAEIALERNINRLNSRIDKITSKVSMQRIYDMAREVGRPAKTLALLKTRLDLLT